MIVIDKKGNEVDVEPVDAKEYVASGAYSFPKADKVEKDDGDKKPSDMKVDELKAKLKELEIDIPEGSKKPYLVKLLEDSEADNQK